MVKEQWRIVVAGEEEKMQESCVNCDDNNADDDDNQAFTATDTYGQRVLRQEIDSGKEIKNANIIVIRTKDGASKSRVGYGQARLPIRVPISGYKLELRIMSPSEFSGGRGGGGRGERGERGVPQTETPIAAQSQKMVAVRSKLDAFDISFVSARRGRNGRSGGGAKDKGNDTMCFF